MKKIITTFLFFAILILSGCQNSQFIIILTPTLEIPSPACEWPCTKEDRQTAQAMRATIEASATLTIPPTIPTDTPTHPPITPLPPSNTPPAGNTYTLMPGDLGWGSVYGTVTDETSGLPISGAAITCEHHSYTSPTLCTGITWTNDSGIFAFVPVFFHDTDRIIIRVEVPGYQNGIFWQDSFTFAALKADISLKKLPTPNPNASPTFSPVCTAPVCPAGQGRLACGLPEGCPGGCGTICATLTPTP